MKPQQQHRKLPDWMLSSAPKQHPGSKRNPSSSASSSPTPPTLVCPTPRVAASPPCSSPSGRSSSQPSSSASVVVPPTASTPTPAASHNRNRCAAVQHTTSQPSQLQQQQQQQTQRPVNRPSQSPSQTQTHNQNRSVPPLIRRISPFNKASPCTALFLPCAFVQSPGDVDSSDPASYNYNSSSSSSLLCTDLTLLPPAYESMTTEDGPSSGPFVVGKSGKPLSSWSATALRDAALCLHVPGAATIKKKPELLKAIAEAVPALKSLLDETPSHSERKPSNDTDTDDTRSMTPRKRGTVPPSLTPPTPKRGRVSTKALPVSQKPLHALHYMGGTSELYNNSSEEDPNVTKDKPILPLSQRVTFEMQKMREQEMKAKEEREKQQALEEQLKAELQAKQADTNTKLQMRPSVLQLCFQDDNDSSTPFPDNDTGLNSPILSPESDE
ncbi:hypothetical protein Pelo_12948 [Pelomyxa schiedti]|nr:hypothetical protein Pelo_12948 [Pelomyxa schiedti]